MSPRASFRTQIGQDLFNLGLIRNKDIAFDLVRAL